MQEAYKIKKEYIERIDLFKESLEDIDLTDYTLIIIHNKNKIQLI